MKHPVSRLLLALLFITATLRAAPPGVTVSRRVGHGREAFVITNVSAGAQHIPLTSPMQDELSGGQTSRVPLPSYGVAVLTRPLR